MSGGGLGSMLGTAAGVALAPETGGLSMAIPGLMGAAGGYLGGSMTGSKNPLMDALLGGVGGGLTGGINNMAELGMGNVGGVGDTVSNGLPSWLGGAGGEGVGIGDTGDLLAGGPANGGLDAGSGAVDATGTDLMGTAAPAATSWGEYEMGFAI